MKPRPTRILVAAALQDAAGTRARPGAIAVRDGRILAAGDPPLLLNDRALEPAAVRSLPDLLILPGLVNAHAHLELTALGPRPYDPTQGFTGWLRNVMAMAAALDRPASAAAGLPAFVS